MTKTGVIKFFDSRDNKRFGFISVDGGGEIFFHLNDSESIVAGESEPKFSRKDLGLKPRQGDPVVFELSRNDKGPKAAPWGLAEEYNKAKEEITNRRPPCLDMYGCGSKECRNVACKTGCKNMGGHFYLPIIGTTCRRCGYYDPDGYGSAL